jgi:hypothetical protein
MRTSTWPPARTSFLATSEDFFMATDRSAELRDLLTPLTVDASTTTASPSDSHEAYGETRRVLGLYIR